MSEFANDVREWLEVDGLGGFASGTVCGKRTRRYHAVLLTATRPPAGRVVLINGFDAWVETPDGTFPISTQRYPAGNVWPHGQDYIQEFRTQPWPTWEFRLTENLRIRQELFVPQHVTGIALRWCVTGNRSGVRLHVRPLLSGRDYHCLHHENPIFRFASDAGGCVGWRPYPELPPAFAESNGAYTVNPVWYRSFVYEQERQRGLDFTEDLGSPGEFHWDFESEEAVLMLAAGRRFSEAAGLSEESPVKVFAAVEDRERQRRSTETPLDRSAKAFFAQRGDGMTIIAGFPWFTDWGRDTFIAMRGLCLHPDRLAVARQILLAWAGTVSDGMLPNRFPDRGDKAEYNSVDASLWYVVAVHDYLKSMKQQKRHVPETDRATLHCTVESILTGYSRGTRYSIQMDTDGLLAAGMSGVQLTWMDAKVDDWVVTPRRGKPVEIQTLWLNALSIGGQSNPYWLPILERGLSTFGQKFWNADGGYLYDVVDVDHEAGTVDDTFRPNQIFAVGGLPHQLLEGERARRVVDEVESRLLTPLGLRSLEPGSADYCSVYEGNVRQRDGAYHQGTVWPWLIGPFVEAWVRVRGNTPESRNEAARRFVDPLLNHIDEAGLGHISEIADGHPPHTPRGCPFQAWSLGELLRLRTNILIADSPPH